MFLITLIPYARERVSLNFEIKKISNSYARTLSEEKYVGINIQHPSDNHDNFVETKSTSVYHLLLSFFRKTPVVKDINEKLQ